MPKLPFLLFIIIVIRTPVRINLSGRKGLYELMLQGISVYDDKEGKA